MARTQEQGNLRAGELDINKTDDFTYLGCRLTSNNSIEEDINYRIGKYSKNVGCLYPLLREASIPREVKTDLYKTILQPILLYGSETWVLTERLKSKLQAAEMKVLRLIKGVTKFDRNRNIDIRASLGIEPLVLTIEKNQLPWYGHLRRRGPDNRAKELMDWRPTQKRPRGRPRRRWADGIENIVAREGIGMEEAEHQCQNRVIWRRFVTSLTTDRST